MKITKLGEKGQITIPRSILKAAGIAPESSVVLEAIADGAIMIRLATAYPIEIYSDERVKEFEEANSIPADAARRVNAYLRKKRAQH